MPKDTIYSATTASDADDMTGAPQQEECCHRRNRYMFFGVFLLIAVVFLACNDEGEYHGNLYIEDRDGVKGHYEWVPDEPSERADSDSKEEEEGDMYCDNHDWCRKAKVWWNEHVDAKKSSLT